MKITDLFRQESIRTGSSSAERQSKNTREVAPEVARARGEDTVSISPAARRARQISGILADDGRAQRDRVAEIKRQVEDGSFSRSSEDVARAVVSFARDTEEFA